MTSVVFVKIINPILLNKWDNEDELEEGYKYEEIEEEIDGGVETEHESDDESDSDEQCQEHFILDGKPFRLKSQTRKQSFTETHVRTTTYLKRNHSPVELVLPIS